MWFKENPLSDSWIPRYKIALENRYRDECDMGFQVQFNVEFTSQVMNFPIAYKERQGYIQVTQIERSMRERSHKWLDFS